MRPTIALFDIDGTLLHADGAGRRAVEAALRELLEVPSVNLSGVEFAGRTDPWIVGAALRQHGAPHADELVNRILERYAQHLPGELQRAESFRVLPGVRELLSVLIEQPDVALGLGTGNTEAAARAKLDRGDLRHFFSFGGFGSDHHERPELIRAGLRRGLRKVGLSFEQCRVIVIGDTPHDVNAARAIGAECIAVCTSRYDSEALERAGADWVVPTLESQKVAEAFEL